MTVRMIQSICNYALKQTYCFGSLSLVLKISTMIIPGIRKNWDSNKKKSSRGIKKKMTIMMMIKDTRAVKMRNKITSCIMSWSYRTNALKKLMNTTQLCTKSMQDYSRLKGIWPFMMPLLTAMLTSKRMSSCVLTKLTTLGTCLMLLIKVARNPIQGRSSILWMISNCTTKATLSLGLVISSKTFILLLGSIVLNMIKYLMNSPSWLLSASMKPRIGRSLRRVIRNIQIKDIFNRCRWTTFVRMWIWKE